MNVGIGVVCVNGVGAGDLIIFISLVFCFILFVYLQAGESSQGLLKKTMNKLSTEYRLQFVWPNVRRTKAIEFNEQNTSKDQPQPTKSISMGVLRGQPISSQHQYHQHQAPTHTRNQLMSGVLPTIHRKRTTHQREGATN